MLFLVIQPCFSIAHSKTQCETFILLNHDNVDARRNWVKQQCSEDLALVRKNPGSFVFPCNCLWMQPFRYFNVSFIYVYCLKLSICICSNLKWFFLLAKSHHFTAFAGEVSGKISTPPIYLNWIDGVNMFYESFDFKDFMKTELLAGVELTLT